MAYLIYLSQNNAKMRKSSEYATLLAGPTSAGNIVTGSVRLSLPMCGLLQTLGVVT